MTLPSTHTPPTRSLKGYFWIAARGFCMGAADVVPGVSGGTMAFILGIYDELLHAIHAVNLDFIRRLFGLRWREAFAHFPWRFLLALGLGIGAAIFTLAESLSWALHHYPPLVWAFFFGLVLASVTVVRKRVRRWSPVTLALAALAAVGAYVLVGLTPTQTPDAPWFLFLSGAIAICAINKRLHLLFSLADLPPQSPHKFRHGHAVWALQHARTMADYKAISQNLMHSDIRVTDGIYAPLLGNEVQQRVAGLVDQASHPLQMDDDLMSLLSRLSKAEIPAALHILADRLAQ